MLSQNSMSIAKGSGACAATGATGRGKLVTLRFKATAAGTAQVRIAGLEPVAVGDTPGVHQAGPVLRVQVKP